MPAGKYHSMFTSNKGYCSFTINLLQGMLPYGSGSRKDNQSHKLNKFSLVSILVRRYNQLYFLTHPSPRGYRSAYRYHQSTTNIVMISTPWALFSEISPLYEDSVKLGASLTSFTVIVTLALAVPPVRVREVIYLQPLHYTSWSYRMWSQRCR